MRKDVNIKNLMEGGNVKVNKSALARQYGCCWKTIDRRLNPEKYKNEKKKRVYTSVLDPFKEMIKAKLEKENVSAMAIYEWLKIRHGYKRGDGIVRKFVAQVKGEIIKNLTIRFETIPGYQAQVDWKESMTLTSKNGQKYTVNIFLLVLGYSRYKYIELTLDREQKTFETALLNGLIYFGGTPEEILFDNMKTVVDHAQSDFKNVVLNSSLKQFAKDALFKIITCRTYSPQTKGKVETLAKIMDRLLAFDNEFEDEEELREIVKQFMYELNYNEKSQATNEIPCIRFEKEKEYLTPINIDLLESDILNLSKPRTYKVTKESMILYKGIKYSVPTRFVGKYITVKEDSECIHLYFNTELINSYSKNDTKRFNYKLSDYEDILNHSNLSKKTRATLIKNIRNDELKSLNDIRIEED